METIDLFKALSDEVRLRILRSVSVAELSVAELVRVLGLPQSTVSRHLKPLRDADLVTSRRDGTSVYYKQGGAFADPTLARLLEDRLEQLPQSAEDLASVRRVMDARRQRSREFFDRVAGSYGTLTQPGGGWQGMTFAMAAGFAGKEVADLGSGEGQVALCLARFARRVVAVDQSPEMVRHVRGQAKQHGLSGIVEAAEGDVESVPLPDSSMDAVFVSQTLHHAADPAAAMREAARVVRAGGHLIVLDLLQHTEEWVRDQWADQWLGFTVEDVCQWMRDAGVNAEVREVLPGSTPELSVLLVVGRKQS